MKAAPGFRISGELEDEEDGLVKMDMTFAEKDVYGTLGLEGAEVEMRVIDAKFFMKAGDEFWAAMAKEDGDSAGDVKAMQQLLSNKWITMDQEALGDDFKDFSREGMLKELVADGSAKKAKGKTIDGIECLALAVDDGTLYVDRETGRPVQFAGDERGRSERSASTSGSRRALPIQMTCSTSATSLPRRCGGTGRRPRRTPR